jgi:regulatory protein YycI of two-component signal transduction system YycFG
MEWKTTLQLPIFSFVCTNIFNQQQTNNRQQQKKKAARTSRDLVGK